MPAPEYKQWDPGLVAMTFAGIIIFGYAEGTMLEVERNTDTFSLKMGAQGDGTRVRSRDRSGRVTFNIQGASGCNDLLSAQVRLDELTGLGRGPLLIKYVEGTDLVTAANAWLVRPSNLEYSDAPSPREWMIEAHELKMNIGGTLL